MIVDCVIYIQVAVQSILYLQKKKKMENLCLNILESRDTLRYT